MRRDVDAWGRVIFAGTDAIELLLRGHDISRLLLTPDETLAQYNQLCAGHDKAAHQVVVIATPAETPAEARERQLAAWLLPDAYRDLPVREALLARCHHAVEIERVNAEMDMFEARGWLPVLRLMFYLVDDWRARGVVWGVGRGSSVASYCLFLIGIHKCDSIAYDLSISEFPEMTTDNPQLDVLIEASGHTAEDALLILTELNKRGWTVQPMTEEQEQAVWQEWMQQRLGSA